MNESRIEKRATPRHRVLKHGMLAFGGGGGVDCTVRNISSGGARLDIANPVVLPQSFTLFIQTDQFMRRCRAVWEQRTKDRRRVRLIPASKVAGSDSPTRGADLNPSSRTRRHEV